MNKRHEICDDDGCEIVGATWCGMWVFADSPGLPWRNQSGQLVTDANLPPCLSCAKAKASDKRRAVEA